MTASAKSPFKSFGIGFGGGLLIGMEATGFEMHLLELLDVGHQRGYFHLLLMFLAVIGLAMTVVILKKRFHPEHPLWVALGTITAISLSTYFHWANLL